jgi:hypothetical protein
MLLSETDYPVLLPFAVNPASVMLTCVFCLLLLPAVAVVACRTDEKFGHLADKDIWDEAW